MNCDNLFLQKGFLVVEELQSTTRMGSDAKHDSFKYNEVTVTEPYTFSPKVWFPHSVNAKSRKDLLVLWLRFDDKME